MDYERFQKIASGYLGIRKKQPITDEFAKDFEKAVEKLGEDEDMSDEELVTVKAGLLDILMTELVQDDEFTDCILRWD